VVRQSAKALGKRVSLDILGSESEVDRNILETMVAPLEHLLRNSVSHGIETPSDREAAGKAEKGELSIDIRHDGNEIVLTLSDDGAGLQYDRIRERGISVGLIGDTEELSDEALAELIFKPGFSTATTIDQISGRGVGMDVVRAEVLGLGGRIEVFSTAGQGTKFVIHLPLTMAISQVMVAGVGERSFAVPAAGVEKVLQLKPEELTAAYEARTIQWADEAVPLYYLASLVDLPSQNPVAQPFSPVMIVRSGGRRIAVHADTVSKAQEVVVKNPGPQVARVDGVAGATVMGNGEVVLIINPARLADNVSDTQQDAAMQAGMAAQLSNVPALVMVVDDSVTVRKVTQRLLVREGFDVLLAKDGVDALRQLQDQRPAVMLVDVEMPRMDGFDLTRALRKESQYADIPIIMITSRTADKHKKFALSLGVNEFLGKPYIESNLIEVISTYLAGAGSDSGVSTAGGADQNAEPLH
jgi:chemosensory pili system protein ChpA (sensor histidine kinase/response regulator)